MITSNQKSKLKDYLPLLPALAAWVFVVYKGVAIPITHDEMATVIHYSKFSPWEIMMYPDPWPNNHILNTLLTKWCQALLGYEPWVHRLPSMLSFGLYGAAAFLIGRLLFPGRVWMQTATVILFVANPYLLDFYSVSRGYGMAAALMLGSAYCLIKGFKFKRESLIWWGIALSLLAAYANFTLLVYWCAANALALVFMLGKYGNKDSSAGMGGRTGILLAEIIAFIALIWAPVRKMQSTNQFQYWEANSFYEDTVRSLVRDTKYSAATLGLTDDFWGVAVLLVCAGTAIYLGYSLIMRKWRAVLGQPWALATAALMLTVAANRLQGLLLGSPNLSGRTALFFIPLFILLLTAFLAHLIQYRPRISTTAASLFAALAVWHMAASINFTHVREWWYDAHTYEVLNDLEMRAEKEGKIRLVTNWHFHRSFEYHTTFGDSTFVRLLPYSKEIDPSVEADYYYIFQSDLESLGDGHSIDKEYSGGTFLLMRKAKESHK